MQYVRKVSGWSYDTSSGGEVSVSFAASVGAGKGKIVFKDPHNNKHVFHYISGGVGAGIGIQQGLLSKGSASVATENFWSSGKLYILDGFKGNELRAEDIEGYTLIMEFSASAGPGAAFYALLLGIDPEKIVHQMPVDVATSVATSILSGDMSNPNDIGAIARTMVKAGSVEVRSLINSGNAILLMGGISAGVGLGASVLGSIGGLWRNADFRDLSTDLVATEPTSMPRTALATNITIPIVLPDNVLFDIDKFVIKQVGMDDLRKAGAVIRLYPNRRIIIRGFTDSTGSFSHNQTLSENRAKAVRDWLTINGFVNASNVIVNGYGESDPIASNRTIAGREQNRRVEIVIMSD